MIVIHSFMLHLKSQNTAGACLSALLRHAQAQLTTFSFRQRLNKHVAVSIHPSYSS